MKSGQNEKGPKWKVVKIKSVQNGKWWQVVQMKSGQN